MTSLSDYLISFSCFLLSAAVAGVAYQMGVVTAPVGMGVGIGIFLVLAQIHSAFLRARDRRYVDNQMGEMRRVVRILTDELETSRDAMRNTTAANEAKAQARNKEIISEVRVIETLIGQLADNVKEKSLDRLDQVISEKSASPRAQTSGEKTNASSRLAQNAAQEVQAERIVADKQTSTDRDSLIEGHVSVFEQMSEDQLMDLIRGALDQNRVDVYIQPIVSLPQRKVRFYESFSYLRTEEGEAIKPYLYVRLAESAGFISLIDNLLLFRCVQIVRRLAKRQPDVRMFCNISMHSLRDQYFFTQFLEFLESNRDLSNHLIFEFGQETMEYCGPLEKSNMRRLSELGYHYSLDKVQHLDLNLGDLRDRNFRYIKVGADLLLGAASGVMDSDAASTFSSQEDMIENSYIDEDDVEIIEADWTDDGEDLDDGALDLSLDGEIEEQAEDESGDAPFNAPVTKPNVHPGDLKELLDRFGMDLIVEKLESERQVVEVVDLDVDYGQGYLFGEPQSIDAEMLPRAQADDLSVRFDTNEILAG